MGRNILLVALGGMLGTVARYLSVLGIVRILPSRFPFGTFVVNVVGCFIMGAAVSYVERHTGIHEEWRLAVTAGFCGGFTTFSAFAFENLELLMDRDHFTFGVYALSSIVVSIVAAFAGFMVFRSV